MQVNTVDVMLVLGGAWAAVTVAVAALVQPLAAVAVRVYCPGSLTDGLGSVEEKPPDPDQA